MVHVRFHLLYCTLSSTESDGDEHPPLAVVFCNHSLRFIFFPFADCIDAIVTPPISLFQDEEVQVVNYEWFVFMCHYLNNVWSAYSSLNPASYAEIELHGKKAYKEKLEPQDTIDSLKVRTKRNPHHSLYNVFLYLCVG